MTLNVHEYWIFDLDGTLTEDLHDFDAIQRALGVERDARLLEFLDALEPARAAPLRARLEAWELDVARRSVARKGARELVAALRARGASVGILTRNARRHAELTLESSGLADLFPSAEIVTRDCGPPKPSPFGIHRLIDRWRGARERAVMVGDYVFDLEAGRAAGVKTVQLDWTGANRWPEHTDVRVADLGELRRLATG